MCRLISRRGGLAFRVVRCSCLLSPRRARPPPPRPRRLRAAPVRTLQLTVLACFATLSYDSAADEIHLPTAVELELMRATFREKKGMDGCVLAIDGTHIPFRPCSEERVAHYNFKQFHSFIMHVAVDNKSVLSCCCVVYGLRCTVSLEPFFASKAFADVGGCPIGACVASYHFNFFARLLRTLRLGVPSVLLAAS
jgi:hypothetical protein